MSLTVGRNYVAEFVNTLGKKNNIARLTGRGGIGERKFLNIIEFKSSQDFYKSDSCEFAVIELLQRFLLSPPHKKY